MTQNLDNTRSKPERNEKGYLLPGQPSLNPEGRPKGSKNLSTMLWEALQERATNKSGEKSDKTHADLFIQRVIKDAIEKGAGKELIFDRIEGQAKQALDITTQGESVNSGADVLAIAHKVADELKKKKTNG